MRSLHASPAFAVAVLVALGLVGFNGLMIVLMQVQPGFLGMAHFTELHHRTHDLTFGFLFVPAIVGMLVQFRQPAQNMAGMVMALIPWVGLVLTLGLTFVLTNNTSVLNLAWIGPAAVTLIAAGLHPAGRDFFRSFSVARVSWLMLGLVVIATVPLLAFAFTNIGLQGTVSDDHARMGHYGFIAAFGFTVIGVGLLASLRPVGWRTTAWVAGLLPVSFGITSLVYPAVSSSLGLGWAVAAIAWGIGFVAVAELSQGAASPKLLGSRESRSTDEPSSRLGHRPAVGALPWVTILGIIALVLVMLVAIQHLTGDGPGPGDHGPPSSGLERTSEIGRPADVDTRTLSRW